MNYYEARQRSDGSGWHYTCENDGQIWPVGYCRDHEPHPTAQEAKDCFRQYLLDDISDTTYGDWTGCEVCDEPTKKGLSTRGPLGQGFPLCDRHRTPAQVEKLTPPVDRIVASY